MIHYYRSNQHKAKKKKKKPAEPTIPEGSEGTGSEDDEDSDSELTEDTGNTNGLSDYESQQRQEQMLAEAMEAALGAAGDDPDIAEAKERLLASKILSPDMFDVDSDDDISDSDIGAYLANGDHADSESEEGSEEEIDEEIGQTGSDSPYDAQGGIYSSKTYQELHGETPSETTSLLGGTPQSSQKLRPSIFTTVASLAETENANEKAKNP